MYYVPYEQKMLKIARIRDQIYRFRYLILAIILAIVSSIVTLLAMKGNITQEVSIQPTYVYGETITPSSKAFLSNTSYEYFDKEWTEEKPVRPGFYQVRAKAKGGFGSYKYSKIQNFTIERRKLSFKLSESVTYGDMPEISFSGLLPGDTVDTSSCIFDFAEITSRQTSVSLKKSSLSISSDRYGDITECYHIDDSLFEGVAIELLPRPITIQISDAEKMYDGTPLRATNYTMSSGTLVKGDSLLMSYTGEQLRFGTSQSGGELAFFNAKGEDISFLYEVKINPGELSITKRPIQITTGSGAKMYDGTNLACDDVMDTGEYSVVEGDEIKVLSVTERLNVGTVENVLGLEIWNDEDVSSCYTITQVPGTLTVTPRTVNILLSDQEKVYDGKTVEEPTWSFVSGDGLVNEEELNIQVVAMQNGEVKDGKKVGEYQLVMNGYSVSAKTHDSTGNYVVNCGNASLKITKRYIEIYTLGVKKIYDAQPYPTTRLSDFYIIADGYELAEGENCRPTVSIDPYVNAGIYKNAIHFEAHIYGGGEETTLNYTIKMLDGENSGRLEIEKRLIEIHLNERTRPYDGTPLTNKTYTFKVTREDSLMPVNGHTAELSTSGSIIEPGEVFNEVVKVKMMDGKDEVTDNYDFIKEGAKLIVTKRFVNVAPLPYSTQYMGEKITLDKEFPLYMTWSNSSDRQYGSVLLEGYSMQGVTEVKEAINVGTYISWVSEDSFIIKDAKQEDVTDKYFEVTFISSTVTIYSRELQVASMDIQAVFGEILALTGKAEDCYISKGALAQGERIEYVVDAELSEVGTTVNRISVIQIYDKTGELMCEGRYNRYTKDYEFTYTYPNYTITITCGTLTLLPEESENS